MSPSRQLDGKSLLVTGATGFIGRHVTRALINEGATVTALARDQRAAKALKEMGTRIVPGDLRDQDALNTAMEGQAAVLHLAYDIRASAAENLSAFDALYLTAQQAGIERFVHASSIVVYDGWPDQPLDETSSMERPGGSPYRQAKVEMERRLMSGSLPAVILQPTLVWGAGSPMWTNTFAEALKNGSVILPDPEGRAELVHVNDLAKAFVAALCMKDPGRERFIVTGPNPVPWSEVMSGYAKEVGGGSVKHVPLADLTEQLGPRYEPGEADDSGPSLAARVSATARGILGRDRFEGLVRRVKRLKGGGDFMPDHHLLEIFASQPQISQIAARDRLGYVPDIDFEKGLELTRTALRSL